MRVLCTIVGAASHGRSLLPLARALAAAGHQVLIAIGPTLDPLAHELAAGGHDVQGALVSEVTQVFAADDDIRLVPCRPEIEHDGDDGHARTTSGAGTDRLSRIITQMTGRMAVESLRTLSPLADDFQPDLVIRDGIDLGGCLLAELRGIPQISPPGGATNIIDPADLLAGLNQRREELGLPVHRNPLSIFPYGRIDYLPPAYSFAPRLPRARSYRQSQTVDRVAVLPEWVARLPSDRPLVFATLGTNLATRHTLSAETTESGLGVADPAGTLRAIIDGLSRLDCVAVVATAGVAVDDAEPAAHVHLTAWLPQPLLLECADLLLTHGGLNSIREAVRTGTAMAVLPQFGDQPHNAQRVRELDLGRAIPEPSPDAIAATCRDVLTDPGITAGAKRAQRATLALPEVDKAVADLEKLIT
jgi:UDP:flavonoid glycosyltransferase YjiC (YdhE family)